MLRFHYSMIDDGTTYFINGEKDFMLHSDTEEVCKHEADRVRMFSDPRVITVDEMIGANVTKMPELNPKGLMSLEYPTQPWNCFGIFPESHRPRLESRYDMMQVGWYESDSPCAINAYYDLKRKASSLMNRVVCTCVDGPMQGDVVQRSCCDSRILTACGCVYETTDDLTKLRFIRLDAPVGLETQNVRRIALDSSNTRPIAGDLLREVT